MTSYNTKTNGPILDFPLCSPLFNSLPLAFQALFLYATTHTHTHTHKETYLTLKHQRRLHCFRAKNIHNRPSVGNGGTPVKSVNNDAQIHRCTRPILVHLCCTFSIPYSIPIAIPKYDRQDVYL